MRIAMIAIVIDAVVMAILYPPRLWKILTRE
jgi:hypothetical protein